MATVQELQAVARPENLRPLRNLVTRIARDEGIPSSQLFELKLSVSEALANVVRHAYEGEPGPMYVRIERYADELEIIVADRGCGLPLHRSGGLGRGLDMIDRAARRSSITSDPGQGTEVRMGFPLAS